MGRAAPLEPRWSAEGTDPMTDALMTRERTMEPRGGSRAAAARRLFATAGPSLFSAGFDRLGFSVRVYPDKSRPGVFGALVWILWGPFELDQVDRGILDGGDVPDVANLAEATRYAMARLLAHCADAHSVSVAPERPDGVLPPGLIEDAVG